MTTKLEQAAQQVVDAWDLGEFSTRMDEDINALREALAEQAEQEPVAWSQERKRNLIKHWALDCSWDDLTEREIDDLELLINAALNAATVQQAEQEPVVKIHKYNEFQTLGSLNLPIGTKLYAAPVRTKDLTDDEIATVYEQDEHHHGEFNYRFDPVSFARAVIAADRELNK